ncbi:hypothetical protein BDQ17DRAFT_1345246 [Cyathus striatus]|nr:hypothetical protein BDQ17DRAFT_1345246 [Cyathus striatus]
MTYTAGTVQDPSNFDKSSIADLVAKHGTSSATAWLEFERYKIWQSAEPIEGSEFPPVQGYMQKEPYAFAWGNPLVSSSAALPGTARAFINFIESQGLRLIWCCVDRELEEILGNDEFGWSTVSCIYEDPEAKGNEGQKVIKDLKKNLNRAEKYDVHVNEVRSNEWTEEDKTAVEQGIRDWKAKKSGVQIASTTLQPWLDAEHRRYWIAKKDDKAIGFLILTPVQGGSVWQIKNAVSFPSAPKGTSEALIYTALKDLHDEQQATDRESTPGSDSDEDEITKRTKNRVLVTFGISASDKLKPVHNLGGWKVSALSKTYGKVASTAGLLRRGEFRSKFASEPDTMFVCYPPDGFGLDGVNALLKVLRK